MEPWDEERADIRAAILSHILVAAQGGKFALKDAIKMFDIFQPDDTPAMPTKEVLAAKVRLFNAGIRGHRQHDKYAKSDSMQYGRKGIAGNGGGDI